MGCLVILVWMGFVAFCGFAVLILFRLLGVWWLFSLLLLILV